MSLCPSFCGFNTAIFPPDSYKKMSVRPSSPAAKMTEAGTKRTRPAIDRKRRGQVCDETTPDPGGRGNTATARAGGFTYSASGEAAKKSETTGKAGNKRESPENSVARETTDPKERGGTTAAKCRAQECTEKCGKAERGMGAEPEAGTGGKPPNRAGPHRPDRDRKAEHSAESGDSPPRDGAGVGQRKAGQFMRRSGAKIKPPRAVSLLRFFRRVSVRKKSYAHFSRKNTSPHHAHTAKK